MTIDWRAAAIAALELQNKPRKYPCPEEYHRIGGDTYYAQDLYWNGSAFVCAGCVFDHDNESVEKKPSLKAVLQAATPRMT